MAAVPGVLADAWEALERYGPTICSTRPLKAAAGSASATRSASSDSALGGRATTRLFTSSLSVSGGMVSTMSASWSATKLGGSRSKRAATVEPRGAAKPPAEPSCACRSQAAPTFAGWPSKGTAWKLGAAPPSVRLRSSCWLGARAWLCPAGLCACRLCAIKPVLSGLSLFPLSAVAATMAASRPWASWSLRGRSASCLASSLPRLSSVNVSSTASGMRLGCGGRTSPSAARSRSLAHRGSWATRMVVGRAAAMLVAAPWNEASTSPPETRVLPSSSTIAGSSPRTMSSWS
mmetsp:Transcript_67719/g.153237  ORF Transcript_67719/g.153237 Transcript_67719/m.153237 type:complete len:291 (-) Transcript_67719:550-1422(-)